MLKLASVAAATALAVVPAASHLLTGPGARGALARRRRRRARYGPARRSSTVAVICSTWGSRPANPWAQSVQPDVTTVPPEGVV